MQDKYKNHIIAFLLVIIVILLVLIVKPHLDTASPAAQAPPMLDPMSGMTMSVKIFDVKAEQAVPTVSFTLNQDALSGWDLHITTTNFTFTPQDINTAPVLGHGHVHLYIDGNLTVVFGPWYQIPSLSPGAHTIRVALANNDHSIYAVNGKYIDQSQTINVK